jgi:ethanolamine kinase
LGYHILVFKCTVEKEGIRKIVLLRIFGNSTDQIINREREKRVNFAVEKTGFGAKQYGYFRNGFVYGFFEGKSLLPTEFPSYISPIAKHLARFHGQHIPESVCKKTPSLWDTIFQWFSTGKPRIEFLDPNSILVPKQYHDKVKQSKFEKFIDLDALQKEAQEIKLKLDDLHSPLVFCHNDLLSGNVIINEENSMLREINFIDFEYASYSFRGFDIANHFCEWAGFEPDYSRFPTETQQKQFLESYLGEIAGEPVTETQINELYREVCKFTLVAT